MQDADAAGPTLRLVAGVLAGDSVDRPLEAALQGEIVGVQGQQGLVAHQPVEHPFGQGDGQAAHRAGLRIHLHGPFVEPAELGPLVALGGADRGLDVGGLQALQSRLQLLIALAAGVPPDRPQQLMGGRVQGGGEIVGASLPGLVQARRGPDQDVGVPDRCNAEQGVAADVDPDVAVGALVLDGLQPFALLQGKERSLHHLPLVLQRQGVHPWDEEVEFLLAGRALAHDHSVREGRAAGPP